MHDHRDADPPANERLALQTALSARGFDSSALDGLMGPATQRGLRQYQRSLGLTSDRGTAAAPAAARGRRALKKQFKTNKVHVYHHRSF
jgi:peptidoglycan hydrolase-like protein with peptidoglycan-binding domain